MNSNKYTSHAYSVKLQYEKKQQRAKNEKSEASTHS